MIEVRNRIRSIDLPYTIRLYGVTDEVFDEMVDEDTKAELFDGVMIVHSPAALAHDDGSSFIRTLMRLYANRKKLGKVLGPDSLVRLRAGRRFAADTYFIRKEHFPARWLKEFFGVPDLMMEWLSPSNRDYDLEEKRPAYRAARVGEIWLVDPEERQVLVDYKQGNRYVEKVFTTGKVSSKVMAGFWIDVAWLWADPLPDELECLEKILQGK